MGFLAFSFAVSFRIARFQRAPKPPGWRRYELYRQVIESEYPVIDITRAVMDSSGEIKASLSSSGITVDDFDLQIGCTALMLNYTVVSNNTRPFEKIPGLKLANWAG